MEKVDLRNKSFSQLREYLVTMGIPAARTRHIFAWLYKLGSYEPLKMSVVKKEIREILAESSFISRLSLPGVEKSKDGTIKYLFLLDDGAKIESVLIHANGRRTLCISSQVGCAMGCTFCLTGRMGLKRNLQPSEIVNQVVGVMEHLHQTGEVSGSPREMINNLVFMGMGEPLANFDNLVVALNILMDQHGFEFTERRVTVSTCGIAPKIIELGKSIRVNLAISLHAADNETRSKLMPINRKYPIDILLESCRNYPLSRKKIILFEYILIKGVNDSPEDAQRLAKKLRGIPCRINLMPFNESEQLPFKYPDDSTVWRFQRILQTEGYLTVVRERRGADISAACGQLAGRSKLAIDGTEETKLS